MVENLGNIDVSKNSENFYFWPVRTKGQFLQKSAFKNFSLLRNEWFVQSIEERSDNSTI